MASYAVLQVPSTVDLATIMQTLKGEVALSVVGQNGTLQYATGIQTAGVLDDLYYFAKPHRNLSIRPFPPPRSRRFGAVVATQ